MQKKTGPKRSFPDAVYRLAYELYSQPNASARSVADAINAKTLCDRISESQIPYLARVGADMAEMRGGE